MRTRRAQQTAGATAYKVFLLIALLLFSEALLGRLFASETNPEGGAFLRLMWLPLYGFAAVGMAMRWRSLVVLCTRSPALMGLIFLAFISALWSIDPFTSFRRGIAILFTTFFGFYLASSLNWKDLLRLLGVVWLILALGNLIAGGLVPGFGVMQEIHVGAWRGLWFEKNAMGGNFARVAFLFGFLLMVDTERRKMWAFGLLSSIMLVLLSTSKTSLLGLMLGIGILMLYLWMKRGRLITVATIWIGVTIASALGALLLISPETLAKMIGRDLTLTGRTDIWEVLYVLIDERPMLGYGYGAFWGEFSAAAQRVRMATEWAVPTAHNGLIEIILSVGWIGGGLFILDYLINFFRALFTSATRVTSLYALGFLVLIAMFSISESVFLQQNNLLWVTYAAVAAKLSFEAHERARAGQRKSNRRQGGSFEKSAPQPALRGRLR